MLWLIAATALPAAVQPAAPLCEWHRSGAVIHDPCPEFWWPRQQQAAWRIQVATSPGRLGKANLWDSGWQADDFNIAEYSGKPLPRRRAIYWLLTIKRPDGSVRRFGPYRFTFEPRSLPSRHRHIRLYVNFGSDPAKIARLFDLTYRVEAKQYNPRILAIHYSLLTTCVVNQEKGRMLERWCVRQGLTKKGILEDMFLHYAEDTRVTLHVGAERADRPKETRIVRGWDPRNDRNGDGYVDDTEFANLVNPKATARRPSQARVPIYYWGPPNFDYVMNIGNPHYQRFIVEEYVPAQARGYDAIYFDTVPPAIPAVQGRPVVEYPGPRPNAKWLRDLMRLFAKIKIALPDKLVFANGWQQKPFVIDGTLREGWLNIAAPPPSVEAALELAEQTDRRGKIQLLQYNPVYDPKENEFGVRVPVSRQRDALYGLACYYVCAGDYTYFAIGQHPYIRSEDKWFPALAVDVGKPVSRRYDFFTAPPPPPGENLIPAGSFDTDADGDGNPDGWQVAEPVELDAQVKHSGRFSARISSQDAGINNINRLYVTLKPNTTYTLMCWIRTENVTGRPGAQVYPYEFDDAIGVGMITVTGTTPWRRYYVVFRTGQDTRGRINFRMFGASGTAWFDDIALYEGNRAPWKVLARRFTKALVIVRPPAGGYGDDTAREFKLDAEYRPLSYDGTLGRPVREIKLRSGEAAILLREPQG